MGKRWTLQRRGLVKWACMFFALDQVGSKIICIEDDTFEVLTKVIAWLNGYSFHADVQPNTLFVASDGWIFPRFRGEPRTSRHLGKHPIMKERTSWSSRNCTTNTKPTPIKKQRLHGK